ncbi:MAG: hypothetical protein AB1531_00665 [Chloroflexota bacterium]
MTENLPPFFAGQQPNLPSHHSEPPLYLHKIFFEGNHWMRYFNVVLKFIISLFESPITAGILSFFVYAIIAAQRGPITGVSSSPYFNYLADAFLHGQLSLRLIPSNQSDLALYNGQYFMYWPPFPAVFFMPFIAISGIGFSDRLFTLALGALNVTLVAYTLRVVDIKNLIPIDRDKRGLLTIFFAFGTVHLLLSSLGIVWFTSQIVAFFCSILIFLAAIRLKGHLAFFFTGLALACATLTRNHLIFLAIWPAYYLYQVNKSSNINKLISYFFVAVLPIVIAVFINGMYNYLRFGNVLEYGLAYQDFDGFFRADFQKYGHFNTHYLLTNFYYNFIFYPFPTSDTTLMGGSLFILSPLFLAVFWAFNNSVSRRSALVLWFSVIAVTIPILLNIGSGWKTFGPRYTLDFTMPLLLLTVLGFQKWPKWLICLLVVISITHYILGTLFFIHVT